MYLYTQDPCEYISYLSIVSYNDNAVDGEVLVYPRTTVFHETLNFRFADDHDLEMACFPFNVADSAGTISAMMRDLLR